jgi:hypothetical protein
MLARIFKPSKSAMQSGRAKFEQWVLEFVPSAAARPNPLMGWPMGLDTSKQVTLTFDSKESAVQFCETHGLAFRVYDPKPTRTIIKAYADNFAYNRKEPWTH